MMADGVQPNSDQLAFERMVARARWQAAEDRIYPLALVDASLYEAAVAAVAALGRAARTHCATEADLHALGQDDLVARARAVDRGSIDHAVRLGVPLDAMCDAARALASRLAGT